MHVWSLYFTLIIDIYSMLRLTSENLHPSGPQAGTNRRSDWLSGHSRLVAVTGACIAAYRSRLSMSHKLAVFGSRWTASAASVHVESFKFAVFILTLGPLCCGLIDITLLQWQSHEYSRQVLSNVKREEICSRFAFHLNVLSYDSNLIHFIRFSSKGVLRLNIRDGTHG